MKKYAIQYSIVQFLPYPEREERVNIGVVAFCPKLKDFRFTLLEAKRKTRVNHFFKPLPKDLFKNTIQLVRKELNRLQFLQQQHAMTNEMFLELVLPRDSLIRYSGVRVLMTDDYQQTLNELFDDLVDFESPTYKKDHDRELAKRFKNILKQHHIDECFTETKLKKEAIGLSVTMPFFNETSCQSVKPLSFIDQKDRQSLTSHAASWVTKIEMLERAELLDPKNHLVTYEKPNGDFAEAVEFALETLDKTKIQLAEINDTYKIENFIQLH